MVTTSQTLVSQTQIDRCERTIGPDGKVFYQVKSESYDENDTTYNVRWNEEHKCLTCDCKGGSAGYSCKHMRWALAAEQEYKMFKRAERAAEQRIAEDSAEYQRETVEQACAEANRRLAELDARENGTREAGKRERAAVARDGYKAYERRPFSLLK